MRTPFPPLALAFASIALAGSAHAQTPKLDAMKAAVTDSFRQCADAYRASMTGKDEADHPFDCAAHSASTAGDATSTLGINVSYTAADQAAQAYVDALVDEARRAFAAKDGEGNHSAAAYLAALKPVRRGYTEALCGAWGDVHFGGTITSSNRAICIADQDDQQIDDLLRLLKEYGVIDNGR